MISWFTGAGTRAKPSDAGAGTFYSAVSNVDFRIDKGNPQAVAIRAHFAQHGFINHCDIRIGSGKPACMMLAMNWKTPGFMAVNMG